MHVPARLSAIVACTVLVAIVAVGATASPSHAPSGPGPIQVALGLDGNGSASAVEALDRRRAAEVARRTTDCMAAAGFDVVARPEPEPAIPDSHLDPVAWARRWGFGISTSIGIEPAVESAVLDAPLSGAVRRAMFGGPDGPGCQDRSRTEVYGLRDRLLAPLDAPLAELRDAIDADPHMRTVLESWRSCAAASVATGHAASPPADRRSFGEAVLSDFARRAAAAAGDADLQRLQAEEREVATALAGCELGYVDGRDAVAHRYETAFAQTHGAALETIGAAIRAAEAAYPADPGS